jgi:hypothetical protein
MARNLPANMFETRKRTPRLMEDKVRSPPVDKVTRYHFLGWTGCSTDTINTTKSSTYIRSNTALPTLVPTTS